MYTLNSELKTQLVNRLNSLNLHWNQSEPLKLTDGPITVSVSAYTNSVFVKATVEGRNWPMAEMRLDLEGFSDYAEKAGEEKTFLLADAGHSSGGDPTFEEFDVRVKSFAMVSEIAKTIKAQEQIVIAQYDIVVAAKMERAAKDRAALEEKLKKEKEERQQLIAKFKDENNCLDEKSAKALLASVKADATATRKKVGIEMKMVHPVELKIITKQYHMNGNEERLSFFDRVSGKKISLKDLTELLVGNAAEKLEF